MLRLIVISTLVFAAEAQELKTASTHPIQYYVSLPNNWTSARKWPVVVVIDSANRQFQQTLDVFARARKDKPFILVAPLVTTNGGTNYRQIGAYQYKEEVWNQIHQDRCGFDLNGIAAVAADIRKLYNGEERYFLAGWEGGGHTVWSLIFQHPETLAGAAPTVTNYAGRCMDAGFSTAPSRKNLPITVFQVDAGRDQPPGKFVHEQSQSAMKSAKEHGFENVRECVVPGKPHGPLADEVLDYFASLTLR